MQNNNNSKEHPHRTRKHPKSHSSLIQNKFKTLFPHLQQKTVDIVQEANDFIANPKQMIKKQKSNEQHQNYQLPSKLKPISSKIQSISKQQISSLNNYQSLNSENHKTKHKIQISPIQTLLISHSHPLTTDNHSQSNQHIPIHDSIDRSKLTLKMKKYQPTNSSFSILYGQKRSMELRDAKKQAQKIIQFGKIDQIISKSLSQKDKFPLINKNEYHKQSVPHHKTLIPQLSFRSESLAGNYKNLASAPNSPKLNQHTQFISQLSEIYRTESMLRKQSSSLIKKADHALSLLEKNYENIKEKYDEATDDVGNYKLEEEGSEEYRKEIRQMWMNNDKRKRKR